MIGNEGMNRVQNICKQSLSQLFDRDDTADVTFDD